MDTRVKIARVGDTFLYQEDLAGIYPKNISSEDSAVFAQSYVSTWLKEQAIIQKAKDVLPKESLDVKKQLEEYEKSLILFAFEKEMVKKRLDTVVSMEEIKDYYSKHSENFKLQDYIVKVLYLKVPVDAPKQNELRKWYKLTNEEDLLNIQNYASLYASNFYFGKDRWIFFDDVLKVIPITDINKASFIRNKRKVTFEEEGYIYYLNVLDYKLKDALSPLSLEKEKIKSILLNIRSTELIKELREEIFNEAKENKNVERF